jgi:hypothetical protein
MPTTPTPTVDGAQRSAQLWQAQRLAQASAPDRIRAGFDVALDLIEHMDEADSELRTLALVVWHCTRAMCTALDARA